MSSAPSVDVHADSSVPAPSSAEPASSPKSGGGKNKKKKNKKKGGTLKSPVTPTAAAAAAAEEKEDEPAAPPAAAEVTPAEPVVTSDPTPAPSAAPVESTPVSAPVEEKEPEVAAAPIDEEPVVIEKPHESETEPNAQVVPEPVAAAASEPAVEEKKVEEPVAAAEPTPVVEEAAPVAAAPVVEEPKPVVEEPVAAAPVAVAEPAPVAAAAVEEAAPAPVAAAEPTPVVEEPVAAPVEVVVSAPVEQQQPAAAAAKPTVVTHSRNQSGASTPAVVPTPLASSSSAVTPSAAASTKAQEEEKPHVPFGGRQLSIDARYLKKEQEPEHVATPVDEAEAQDATPLTPNAQAAKDEAKRVKLAHDMKREHHRSMHMMEGWIEVQERTFLRWCNWTLSKRQIKIEDLKSGVSDGVALCALVEILSREDLPAKAKKPKNQVVRLDNIRLAMTYLEKQRGVHLVNVRAHDVEAGNIKIILGLVWGLIQKYSIIDIAKKKKEEAKRQLSVDNSTPTAQGPEPSPVPTPSTAELSAKAELLSWVASRTNKYSGVGQPADFGKSWQDGKILAALVDSLATEPIVAPTPQHQNNKSSAQFGNTNGTHGENGLTLTTTDEEQKSEGTDSASSSVPPTPSSQKVLTLTSEDSLEIVQGSIDKAEQLYAIPPLMDAADIVHRPQEQSLMTYISMYREYVGRMAEEAEARRIAAEEAARKKAAEEAEAARRKAAEEEEARRRAEEAARLEAERLAKLAAEAEEARKAALLALPEDEEVVIPISPLKMVEVDEADGLGHVNGDDQTEEEKNNHLLMTPDQLAAMAARPRSGTHSSLVGAYIDHNTLDKVSSPYDSEEQAKKDAANAPKDIERNIPLDGSSSSDEGPKPDINAVQDYSHIDEDHEGKAAGETLQQSYDRRIEQMMNCIEICIVTPEQKYLQSDKSGVKVHEVNSATATWSIVDGAGGWKFLRDSQSNYLASDASGRVFTTKKNPDCRFRIIRGATQYFEDSHGHTLSVLPNNTLQCQPQRTDAARFKICFPVVEGILQKKGSGGLRRWQARYFAFNGNVMSYWRKQNAVGKERPSSIYHPSKMLSVNINRQVAKRFNIVFADKKVVELLAPSVEECIRWVRALNSRGIRTVNVQQRLSMFPDARTINKDGSLLNLNEGSLSGVKSGDQSMAPSVAPSAQTSRQASRRGSFDKEEMKSNGK